MIFSTSEKIKSREETIISPYRDNFGFCLPPDKQYWTLSAQCFKNNELIKESELAQMTSSNLIQPNQFYGVDIDKEVVDINSMGNVGNFIQGEFYKVISNHSGFNPGVINLDLLRTFETEFPLFKKVFLLLSDKKYNQLIYNVNVLIESHRVKRISPESILERIGNDPKIVEVFKNYGWSVTSQIYSYKGIGPMTKMFSLTLIKDRNDI